MTPTRSEVLQGTLDMLVLKLLSVESAHGWGLSFRLRQISREVFDVNQGSLYPALQRMRDAGVVVIDVAPDAMAAAVVNQYLELKSRGAL